LSLKKKAAERIGAEVEVVSLNQNLSTEEIKKQIKDLNSNSETYGIMVQLPLPNSYSKGERDEIVNSIAKEKDVDGMREDSPFLTPVVKAVLEVIKEASEFLPVDREAKVVVVGATGFEGKKIMKILTEMGYQVEGADSKTENLNLKTSGADILISATGQVGLIAGEMMKNGAVVIDVGSPKGDVRTEEVIDKVAYLSPVPGGIGPVTITMLLENLILAIE
jgi:methylenetetrahydrofolate dehydrogenase (NADP+)/methenyltetrahydrofolate cyclohydrolase